MDKFVGILLLIFTFIASSYARNCSDHVFTNNAIFATCNRLSVLNSFLHWTYHPANRTVDVAYRHTGVTAPKWVAWALNVGGSGMRGAQCLVAILNSGGGAPRAYTSPITSYSTQLQPGNLSFQVPKISAEFSNGEIVIFATLVLPTAGNATRFNTVWQDGPLSGTNPSMHPTTGDNIKSTGSVDFATGQTCSGGNGPSSVLRRRNVSHHSQQIRGGDI